MPANREPLHEASDRHSYYYRRSLSERDYLPALAVGIGAGLAAFYLYTRFAQRTPLLNDSSQAVARRPRHQKGTAG
jgi:hypothetical protein